MSKLSIFKTACAMGLAAACVWGLAGCSSESESGVKLTGGVAATVNGTEISEDEVTLFVESVRTSYGVTDSESWGEWMNTYGYTPESVREEVIDGLIDQELIRQGAQALGITAAAEEIDSYVDGMKSYYGTDEDWAAALESAGLTEEEYRDSIEMSLLAQGVEATFADVAASEEDVLLYAQMYSSAYDGAKRSSHILFSDEAVAQEVLDKLLAGEIEFADAAAEYSQDSSAANGGDVGWDAASSFVAEYQEALDALNKGEMSGLVVSTFGTHIIMCTDVFAAPEEVTSVDQLPAEFAEIAAEAAAESAKSEAYSTWLEEQRAAAEIVINEMPAGLSYYFDMSVFDVEEEAAEEGEAETHVHADGTVHEGPAHDEGEGEGEAEAEVETHVHADGTVHEGPAHDEGEATTAESQPAAE